MNLEPIKARLAAATLGPEAKGSTPKDEIERCSKAREDVLYHAPTDIAELVAEVERLRAVVDAVRELHHRDFGWCTCRELWPCETWGALGETEGE